MRCLASGLFVLRQVLNLGVTVYTPAVALNTVIGIPYWASLVGITVISIIFNILVRFNFDLTKYSVMKAVFMEAPGF